MDRNNQNQIVGGRPVTAIDTARANEYFEQFVNAATLKHILGYYRGLIENLNLKPNVFTQFYPKLRAGLNSWRAKALWKKFDARASHKCYHKGKAATNTRVLVIGGGPCGMRAAIEAQLLGAKVVVVEKRDRFSRNNVLHLWPFVIEDLRMLGAKKFFGKFCAGSIDHISIRQLQCILLKVALLLGVEVHTEVSFEKLIEPSATEKTGWRAEIKPANHPVSHYEFDVIIGADGKRNTLHGFSRKEFRGKLAIAITANFINKKTEAEARVEEISGVAFIFNQKFFKELQEKTRIDLENIVYYKDDTHYFVMTAKKASLLEKGVIKQDLADTEKLLAPENVDRQALQQYAIEAANFSTNYEMSNLEFAVNHYGQPDIAMFDFTSMYAAENASKVLERNGHRLLMILVGDSLLEPFWPTGSGCARGFLSSLDAAWAIRSWSLGTLTPLDVLAERESIYRLLAQTTPDNLNKDWKSYTLDPSTRYPNLNKAVVTPLQVVCLYDTDNPSNIDKMKRSSIERPVDVPRKRRKGNVDNDVVLSWLKEQLKEESDITITDIGSGFKEGKALCAIIHHYRPDLLDYNSVKNDEPVKNNQLAIDVLEKELGIPPVMSGQDITNTEDYLTMATYLTEVYNSFKGEIPHVKHPKLEKPTKIPKSISTIKEHPPKVDSVFKRNLSSKIPKAIKSSPEKSVPTNNALQGKYSVSKKSFKSSQTLESSALVKVKDLAYSSSISTAIYRKSSKLTRNEIEVIFVKPERKKFKRNIKKCRKCKSSKIPKMKICETESDTETHILFKKKSKKSKSSDGENTFSIKSFKTKSTNYITERKTQKNENILSKEQNQLNHTLELLKQERNKKMKNFMTKLLIKNKKVELVKTFLPIITETEPNENLNNARGDNFDKNIDSENKNNFKSLIDENAIAENKFHIEGFNEKNTIRNEENKVQDLSQRKSNDRIDESAILTKLSTPDYGTPREREINSSTNKTNVSGNFTTDGLVKIRLIERKTKNKFTLQQFEFVSSLNQLTVSSKIKITGTSQKKHPVCSKKDNSDRTYGSTHKLDHFGVKFALIGKTCVPSILLKLDSSELKKSFPNYKCQTKVGKKQQKFSSKKKRMLDNDGLPNQIYSRVSNWISSNDFLVADGGKGDNDAETVLSNSKNTDFTSVSKADHQYDRIIVEERTDVLKFDEMGGLNSSAENFTEMMKNMNNAQKKSVRTLSKFSQYSPFQACQNLKSVSAPPTHFSVIVEGEESELPESTKVSDLSFKTIKTSSVLPPVISQPSRPSSRHKRHIEMPPSKPCSIDRKARKRRTLEKVGASVMFHFFLRAVMETGIVAVVLFILDILINSEQYGYHNYFFSS